MAQRVHWLHAFNENLHARMPTHALPAASADLAIAPLAVADRSLIVHYAESTRTLGVVQQLPETGCPLLPAFFAIAASVSAAAWPFALCLQTDIDNCGFGNRELQSYERANAVVKDGQLVITVSEVCAACIFCDIFAYYNVSCFLLVL